MKGKKQPKQINPVDQEMYDLLNGSTSNNMVVDVVTANYKPEVPQSILDYIEDGKKKKKILEELGIFL